ncbi:MAG: hypothetical protein V4484_18190 [Pseudomonadota bacterium]
MRKQFFLICALAAFIAQPGISQAQSGPVTRASDLMPRFVDVNNEAVAAEARLLLAAGIGEQVAAIDLQAKAMSREATAGMVEQLMAARKGAALALAAKLATPGLTLDSAARQQFGIGIDGLARAIKQWEEMSADMPGLKQMMRDGGIKTRNGLYVAKSLPDYLRDARQELAAAVTFARANKIDFASEVNAMVAP